MTPHVWQGVWPKLRRGRRTCRRLLSSPAAATSTPAPEEGAATLPNELIFDILSRLSVRSVCRFRCVSNEWSALVADAAFVAAHKSRHVEPVIVVISHEKSRRDCNLLLMDMDGNTVRVIKGTFESRLISTSVDELVCATDDIYGGVHVIDPAYGKVLVDRQHLAIYGFGRAVPSGVYKVVCIWYSSGCEVLTLGEDTGWRLSPSPRTSSCLDYTGRSPVVVNGVMYFSLTLDMYNFTLHCFDLQSEEWKKTIKGPEITAGHNVSKMTIGIHIAELNNALCIVQSEIDLARMTNNQHANIWLLTYPDKDIWIKAYTIPMAASTYDYRPLRVTHDGGKLIFHSKNGEGRELRVYDPDTKTCTSLWKIDTIADDFCLCNLNLDRFVYKAR
ncbi:unnamed protein product [Alopecurus aequalis]